MSFSKAKLIRFNEIIPSSPSPASNNLKSFEKPRKAASSIGNQSPVTSENGSVKSVPVNFKTPTLPKKIKTALTATKIKPKDLFNNDLEALKEKTEECENKTKYIHKLTEELDNYKHELNNINLEKELLQREHQNELQDLEFEMLKTMTKFQKQEEDAAIKLKGIQDKLDTEIEKLMKAQEYQVGQVVLDYEIKIKDLKESCDDTLKTRLDELESIWSERLKSKESESEAILNECQAISEYSIIQCEMEKKEIQKSLDDTRMAYEKLKKKYEMLLSNQDKFDKNCANTEKELKHKIQDLTKVIQEKENEVKKLNLEVKAYQLTIGNSQITIEVLKRRLIDSDRDVEQLKQELSRCEEKLLDYEGRYFHLNVELKEAKDLNEDLEVQYESAIELNADSVEQIKEDLLAKVRHYEDQVKLYSKKVNEEQNLKGDIIEQLNNNIEIIKQINLEVEKTEEYYALKTKDLEEVIDCYKTKEKFWSNKIEMLNDENETFKATLKQKENIINELEERLQEFEEKTEDLTAKCMYYKAKSEEFEAEAKESSQTRKKYIEISGKYDELLQDFELVEMENRQSKIQMEINANKLERLLKIEEQFDILNKEKEMLESENMFYKNKFEDQKMKKYKFAAKDKENIGSPNRSVIESPNRGSPFRGSPFRGSPFRERN